MKKHQPPPVETHYCYSRSQALHEGVLIDLTPAARRAGFACPAAVTRAFWQKYAIPDPDHDGHPLVLWAMLFTLYRVVAGHEPCHRELHPTGEVILFSLVACLPGQAEPEEILIQAVFSPGDFGETVLTLLLPTEV